MPYYEARCRPTRRTQPGKCDTFVAVIDCWVWYVVDTGKEAVRNASPSIIRIVSKAPKEGFAVDDERVGIAGVPNCVVGSRA